MLIKATTRIDPLGYIDPYVDILGFKTLNTSY